MDHLVSCRCVAGIVDDEILHLIGSSYVVKREMRLQRQWMLVVVEILGTN